MADRPILFSGPMVLALLAGTKTQTRRVVPQQPTLRPDGLWDHHDYEYGIAAADDAALGSWMADFQRLQRGDRLWVREAHQIYDTHGQNRRDGLRWGPWGGLPTTINGDGTQIAYYRAGFDRCDPGRWRPSIHMPRWASRLTLTVTEVRVQRLQDISEEDAIAEGADLAIGVQFIGGPAVHTSVPNVYATPRKWYRELWDNISGAGSWEANPWVAAYTFTVRLGNIDLVQP